MLVGHNTPRCEGGTRHIHYFLYYSPLLQPAGAHTKLLGCVGTTPNEISGFHRDVDENGALMGNYAWSRCLITQKRKVLIPNAFFLLKVGLRDLVVVPKCSIT